MTVKISSLTKGLVAHFPLNSKSGKVGSELVTNGDFSTNDFTNWTEVGTATNTNSAATGAAVLTNTSAGTNYLEHTATITSGKRYRYNIVISGKNNAANVVIRAAGVSSQTFSESTTNATKTGEFVANNNNTTIQIGFIASADNISTVTLDDISVKEIETADTTPNANHGTVYGATQNSDDMTFDGTDDYALLPTTIINADSDKYWTVSAWIKPSQISGSTVYSFFGSNGASRNIELGIYNQELYFYTNLGATTRKKTTDSPINSTNWHHVVFVRNNNDVLTTYVDGVLDNTSTNAALTGGVIIANSSTIGALRRSNDSQSRYFSGSIKDVRIYNRTLSATEVKSLYDLKGQSGGILI